MREYDVGLFGISHPHIARGQYSSVDGGVLQVYGVKEQVVDDVLLLGAGHLGQH